MVRDSGKRLAPLRGKTSRRLPQVGGKAGSGRVPEASSRKPSTRRIREQDEAASSSRDSERLDAEGVRFGVAIKIALAVGGMILVLVAIFSLVMTHVSVDQLNRSINEGGARLSSIVAAQARTLGWPKPEDPLDPARPNWQKFFGQIENVSGLLDVWLMEKTGQRDEILMAMQPLEVGGMGQIQFYRLGVVDGNVSVSEGSFQNRRFRRFERPVDVDLGDRTTIQVFLSAETIDETNSYLRTRIITFTVVGILIGVACSLVLAWLLTRPIRRLERDMRTVSGGNLDYKAAVSGSDEIARLAETFNHMVAKLKAAQEAEVERRSLEHELNIAHEIQNKLLPDKIPEVPGCDLGAYYLPAKEVGGDYYDFIVIDPQNLGIVVADVSGKGIPGSMVMTMVRSLLRLASVRNVSPGDTLRKVNRILAKDMRRGMFVTVIYMVLNVPSRQLTVCSAGHNPLVICRGPDQVPELVNPKGIALGFDRGPIFDANITEEVHLLRPGDRVVAYTDGVIEAMSEKSEEYGTERFYELCRQASQLESRGFIESILADLSTHRGKAEQSDDITISTIRVLE